MEGGITIRLAEQRDFVIVADLMDDALAPYYGGNHRAHAERIFSTHITGGHDHIGHFSFEQKMFVAEMDGEFAGVVHVVGKRQCTYKISPLIVAPDFRGKRGVGTALLAQAEQYAREHGARQLYCTVSLDNYAARQFFLRHGFIEAGSSDSHYKVDSTEVMLYRLLDGQYLTESAAEDNISVVPFEEQYREQATALILERLAPVFMGIDQSWINALFTGYLRRDSGDINTKFKLIYVAVNRAGEVLGIAGATPKKGQPIKLMPFVAVNIQAFEALMADLPHMLAPYGHKLYVHLVPTVAETVALQRRGWQLNGVMPAAYHDEQVTQQWSFTLGSNTMRTMRVKRRYLDEIMSGRKPLEVRVGYDNIRTIQPGELIRLQCHDAEGIVLVEDVQHYETFAAMLEIEDAGQIVPGQNKVQVLRTLQEIYPPAKEQLGVIVLFLQPQR